LATLFTFGDKSRSEWRRLFSQEAIEVNEKTATDPIEKRKDGDIIRIGKHDFRKIKSE
jgi:16S rRNA U516 pseudouridylate synthase RsuA-like enzyme